MKTNPDFFLFGRKKKKDKKVKKAKDRKGFFAKIGSALKRAGLSVAYAPLLMFVPAMKKILKDKGKTPERGLVKLTNQFFAVVIKGRDSFREYKAAPDFDALEPLTISAIISAIVTFFKGLKDKRDRGEELGKTEKDVLVLIDKTEAKIEEMKEEEIAQTVGEGVVGGFSALQGAGGWILAGVAVIVIYSVMKK